MLDTVPMGRKGDSSERVSLKRRLDDEAEEEEEYDDADQGDDGEADEGEDEFMPPVEGLQEALIVLLERVTSDCFRPLNRMNVRLRTSGPPPRYRQSRSEPVKATSRRRRVAPAARRIVAGSRGCPLAWLNDAGSAAFGQLCPHCPTADVRATCSCVFGRSSLRGCCTRSRLKTFSLRSGSADHF